MKRNKFSCTIKDEITLNKFIARYKRLSLSTKFKFYTKKAATKAASLKQKLSKISNYPNS